MEYPVPVVIQVPEDQWQWLEAEAQRRGVTVERVITDLLAEAVKG